MNKVSQKWLLYFGALLITVAMVCLGFWQLSRAEQKQTIKDFVVAQQSQHVNLNQEFLNENMLYQQVTGQGKFLLEYAILVDNQVYQRQVGYHIVVPFQLSSNEQVVLVNVGWVAVGASREIKPNIELPQTQLEISGRLQKPHAKPPLWLEKYALVHQGVWQFLPLAEFTERTGLTVSPLLLELDEEFPALSHYPRQWREYDDKWINRHKAYALQWFSMAIVFILMCLVLKFRSRRE